MANEQNLRPCEYKFTQEDSKKGAKRSAEVRRAKKTMSQLATMMLNAEINGNTKEQIKNMCSGMADEDVTVAAAMMAGQIKSAMRGDSRAFNAVTTLVEKQEEKDERELEKEERAKSEKWTIPITDITSDFVDIYRTVHETFEGEIDVHEIISKGGRGSIKSNFWSNLAYETIRQDNQAHVVYTRRYKTDLRSSVYNQFMKTVIRYDDLENWEFRKSPMCAIYQPTGQMVMFVGADKPISLKSFNVPFGYVKMLIHEECDEMAGVEQMDNIEDTWFISPPTRKSWESMSMRNGILS